MIIAKGAEAGGSFFISLQYPTEGYIALNCTKTATVYRLLGNAPEAPQALDENPWTASCCTILEAPSEL